MNILIHKISMTERKSNANYMIYLDFTMKMWHNINTEIQKMR